MRNTVGMARGSASGLTYANSSNIMLDMKSASIRTVQHQLAAMIAEVEKGGEIVITRRNQPVARLLPMSNAPAQAGKSPSAVRSYWRNRRLPPAVRSQVTHADLIASGRGEV